MSFASAQRDYENQPDEDESPICGCGEFMDEVWVGKIRMGWNCTNGWCPSKFDGKAKEMAERILELEEEKYRLMEKIKRQNYKIDTMSTHGKD